MKWYSQGTYPWLSWAAKALRMETCPRRLPKRGSPRKDQNFGRSQAIPNLIPQQRGMPCFDPSSAQSRTPLTHGSFLGDSLTDIRSNNVVDLFFVDGVVGSR